MTTQFIGAKEEVAKLEFTIAKVIPNKLYRLSNPLYDNEMKIEELCDDGDIFNLLNIMNTTTTITTTTTSTEKYEKNMIKQDSGYLIPLNIDENIKKLIKRKNEIKEAHYFKIDKSNNYYNYFIYQLVNNEPYVLVSVIKNQFLKSTSKELYYTIEEQLEKVSTKFKNIIEKVNENKNNSRNTYSLYGGCLTMTEHPNYAFPTKSEKYCQCSIYIYDYMLKHNIEFKNIQYDNIYIDFIKDKKLKK